MTEMEWRLELCRRQFENVIYALKGENGRWGTPNPLPDSAVSYAETGLGICDMNHKVPNPPCDGNVKCANCGRLVACDGRHYEPQYCSDTCEALHCESTSHPGCPKCSV